MTLHFFFFIFSCQPIKEFHEVDQYGFNTDIPESINHIDPDLPTIVILADNSGTEIVDLLAPFYIFSSTHQFNVVIVAPEKRPFLLWKGVFAMPHFSIGEIQHIQPDLIVVPALSNPSDSALVRFLKSRPDSRKLGVCEGSRTLAHAGLLDSVVCTSHASSLSSQKKEFPKANWQANVKYTGQNLIFTTAGVSAAVEGSLYLVKVLLGEVEMKKIMDEIHYPTPYLRVEHRSNKVDVSAQLNILFKTWFENNKRIGVLLGNEVDELQLAVLLDTYARTFPSKIETFTEGDFLIVSKYGLQLFPISIANSGYDEIHIPKNVVSDRHSQQEDQNLEVIDYDQSGIYLFPEILARIERQYSPRFRKTVERLLDYN